MDSYFYLFIRLLSAFLSFLRQDANKIRSNCAINLGDRHPNNIELASYYMTLRLHDIKKLTSVSLEYTMEIHLADTYILPFW